MIDIQLNKQQQAAVEHIEGPLLVVAGPGTGKTQLLSARAAHILQKTDSKPENILALTYTDKAAQNMRERLINIIGVEARKIVVKTFHGLGVELINAFPEYFWNGARFKPAPEAVEIEIMESILLKRPLSDPYALKFGGSFTMAGSARSHISQAKRAGLTPGKLRAIAQYNIAYLETLAGSYQDLLMARISKKTIDQYRELLTELQADTSQSFDHLAPFRPIQHVMAESLGRALAEVDESGKTSALSEWKREWTAKEGDNRVFKDMKRSARMVALSEIYELFQSKMFERGFYDFDDMILEVIEQLESNEDFRSEVQERFSHIMIDEFQDTNDAQFRLSYLIASHPAQEGRPNIMAVGDDDQAIYRFQGAQLSNIDNFTKSYQDTKEIVLTQNYRSHQSVIDTAASVASMIDFRLVDLRESMDKNLIQVNLDVAAEKIEHHRFASEPEQLAGVVEAAQRRFEDGDHVGILSRRHAPLERLAHLFHQHDVPISYSRRNNILDHPGVKVILLVAQVVTAIQNHNRERVNAYLVQLLGHPCFGVEADSLWNFGVEMRQRARRDVDWMQAALSSDNSSISEIAQWLVELGQIAHEEPAAVMIEHCMGLRALKGYASPIRDYYLDQDSALYVESLSAFHKLRDLVSEFSIEHPSLNDFVRFIELNQNHNVKIVDESAFVSSERTIELMSVHAAKGLEFDHVFVIDATDSSWTPGGARFRPPSNIESMRPYGDSDDDFARLMYVALTRAKSGITVTSYATNEHGKEVLATPLVEHLPKVSAKAKATDIEVAENALYWPQPPIQSLRQIVAPLLENYEMSVTHLINFIDVERAGPAEFIERNILRLPSVKTVYMAYGTAIHAALEQAQRDVNQDNFSLEKVEQVFSEALIKEQLPLHDEERYLDQGVQLMKRLFTSNVLNLSAGDQPERSFRGVKLASGAVINGKLDLVSQRDASIKIVDYKTGGGLSSLATKSKKDGTKALKHSLQLTFYALLAQQSGLASAKQRIVGEMVYVESEDPKKFNVELEPDQADIDKVAKLISVAYDKIMSLDWPDVSGYSQDRSGIEQFMDDLLNENV